MHFPNHTKKRCQQRGISPDYVMLMDVLGMKRHLRRAI